MVVLATWKERQMNERIKLLAEQASKEAFPLVSMAWVETFAELIVAECIEQASIGNSHGNNQWDKALTFAADNIKKHFGVEE